MNSALKKVATALVSLFLVSYVIYQTYSAFHVSVKTQRVYSGSVSDYITTEGFVLHDDTVIDNPYSGIVDFAKDDGDRVAKGGVVAKVYPTSQDAANERKLLDLNSKISQLQQTGSYEEVSAIDIGVLDSEIEESFLNLAQDAEDTNTDQIADEKTALLGLLNKKQLATGVAVNFNARLQQLIRQRDALSTKIDQNVKSVYSTVAGYFVSSTDGYEGQYQISNVLHMTSGDLSGLLKKKVTPAVGAVGKVVSDYEWYIACSLELGQAQKLKVGDEVKIKFLLSAENAVPVTVAAVNRDSTGKYCVVFSCGYMTSKLAAIRKQTMQVITADYTGIKVQNNMVHIVNGVKGVFVRNGNTAKFKKIDVVYSGNGYLVSSDDDTGEEMLQPYDEVILNGDNLYDGKIIK